MTILLLKLIENKPVTLEKRELIIYITDGSLEKALSLIDRKTLLTLGIKERSPFQACIFQVWSRIIFDIIWKQIPTWYFTAYFIHYQNQNKIKKQQQAKTHPNLIYFTT